MRKATLTLVILCAVACSSTSVIDEGPSPGLRVADGRAPNAGLALNTVRIIDPGLQDQKRTGEYVSRIAVESNNARRSATGTLEVWAVLRNRTDYLLTIEGRVQFYDASQAPVEGPTAWQRLYLPSNGVASYREYSAGTTNITYYYIEVRESQ